jgi:hypothetical protein
MTNKYFDILEDEEEYGDYEDYYEYTHPDDVDYLYHRVDEVDRYNEIWTENIPF